MKPFTQNEPTNQPGTAHTADIGSDGQVKSQTWQQTDRWQYRINRLDVPSNLGDLAVDIPLWLTSTAIGLQIGRYAMRLALTHSPLALLAVAVVITALVGLTLYTVEARFGARAFTYRAVLTALSFLFVLL
jgi:hypothetical protein